MHQTPLYISNLPEVLPPFALRSPSQKTNVQNFSPLNLHVIVKTVLDQAGLFFFSVFLFVFILFAFWRVTAPLSSYAPQKNNGINVTSVSCFHQFLLREHM